MADWSWWQLSVVALLAIIAFQLEASREATSQLHSDLEDVRSSLEDIKNEIGANQESGYDDDLGFWDETKHGDLNDDDHHDATT